MTLSCGMAVMAKASLPGRTKTRLVPPLTFDEAAALNTAFLRDIAANILNAGPAADITGYMAFGPPGSERFFRRHLPPAIGLIEAWFPDFGECLFVAIKEMLRRGHGAAVVLNSDSPTLPTALLTRTAELLAEPGDVAVLGPARDGGYYLLGLKAAHRRLFEDVDWSTERVAEQTLARAGEIGLPMHVLPTWYDVDDSAALYALLAEIRTGHSFDARALSIPPLQEEGGERSEPGGVPFPASPPPGRLRRPPSPAIGGGMERVDGLALQPNMPAHTAALLDTLLRRSNLAARLGMPHEGPIERMAV